MENEEKKEQLPLDYVEDQAGHAEEAARRKSENLHREPESDAEEAIAAMDDQHKEVMIHIMDESIKHIVRVEATAAAIVAAGLHNPDIKEGKESLTHKILNSHRQVEARGLITAACALLRLSDKEITMTDVGTYDGLATALVNDNRDNFRESFSKSVDDTMKSMLAESEPDIVMGGGK